MKKSLVAILHYNSVQYTDTLYEMLKPYEDTFYDLVVIDNGSEPQKVSKYTTFRVEQNTYYGGGLDITMSHFLENEQYDSMMLLNSDLIIHGYGYVKGLRDELFASDDLMVVSGCVLQPSKEQCHWKAVHNWGSKVIRYVPWVDYQCCLLKREFVEEVQAFGSKFGWVQDIMTGIVCKNKGWKIGVCDWLPAIHFGNGSVKDNSQDAIISRYNQLAEQEMFEYFQQKGLWNQYLEQRKEGELYKFIIA